MTKLYNLIKSHVWILFVLFLGVDYVQSNYHYSNLPVDGDLCRIAAPFKWYEDIMNDPVGISAVMHNEKYAGAARFTCHQITHWWFKHIPPVVNKIVKDKVHTIYYTSTLLVALLHLCFIWIAFQYAKGKEKWQFKYFIPIGLMASVLVQYGTFYGSIGIIDRSISYVFFYAVPIMALLIYFLPFYKNEQYEQYNVKSTQQFGLLILAPILAFSSALIQPIVFLLSIFYFFGVYIPNPFFSIKKNNKLIIQLLTFLSVCIYAFYVSKFNSESSVYKPLSERYFLMFKGLYYIIRDTWAWKIILVFLGINIFYIHKLKLSNWTKIRAILFFVVGLCAAYTFLLPMGGFRVYRPFIIRYDTFIPVTLGFSFLLLYTSYILFVKLRDTKWLLYTAAMLLFSFVFFYVDIDSEKEANYCQQGHLYEIEKSTEKVISRPFTCNMMTWTESDIHDEENRKGIDIMLRRWGLIDQNQRIEFYSTEK